MIIEPADPIAGGVVQDSERRDIIQPGEGPDRILLRNDAKTDTVMGLEDGIDLIDLTLIEASFEALSIEQVSLTDYIVDYLNEERIRITFNTPLAENIPEDGLLLDAEDFIFAPGLPSPNVQLIQERMSTEKEVIFGTTLPDVFLFNADGERDTVRRFEQGKDRIDLASYGVNFGELQVTERKVGRLSIKIPTDDPEAGTPDDWLVIIDINHAITAEDLTSSDFIF